MDENEKMVIIAFDDKKYNWPADVPPFKVHVNPEKHTQSVCINFSNLQAPGSSGKQNKHNHIEPQTQKFDLLLDRTGALGNEPNEKEGVDADIEHFKKLTVDYSGKIHKPRYLILSWGKLLFKCQLQKLDVEYKMFNRKGLPLRAVLKTTFKEFMENKLREAKENKNSPDLTHVRMVKEGDTLPLMTHRIYGEVKYYLEVARANGITNFRNLQPGKEIAFPPIKQSSE